ncbi:MAG TPA: PVC-type heme-binding CxxCH protein [Bryobacteraceae bacterium]|nr:PVC-type heme-binding CxxCH protein [Bryobacteraceae bacterium]
MLIRGAPAPIAVSLLLAGTALTCALIAFHPADSDPSPVGLGALKAPPGFKVERVAGPDLVSYPMMGTFDDRGRLFICESSGNTLNNQQMAANPDYRIRLLEDRDGDGAFDHSQVFADKLTLPAGAVWYRNSLYVASPPDLLRFDDTDGDGVADKREVVVTGWNMSANAASLHGPFFGPDGWLYLTDGRHGFNIKTKDGRQYRGLASRIWRVRPDGTGLEPVAGGGFDNPVELVFTPAGESIGTMTYFRDPENGERDALLHFVEGGVYPKRHPSIDEFKRTGDLMPVMTKFARIAPSGLARYRGSAFGPAYRENLFTAQFNPHRVQRHEVIREGATFRTVDSDFLISADPDFHPTDVLEDVDGSLLVFDTGAWFIHGCPISRVAKPEIKGGIYRIRKTGAAPARDGRGLKLNFASMSLPAVAKLLEDPRPFLRDRAVEFLVEAGPSAVPPLAAVRKSAISYEARAAAVFALYRIGTAEALAAVRAALTDADFRVRLAASRCAGMAADRDAVDRLTAMARREHPAARRQAIAALGQIDDPRAVPALLAASANPGDRFVEHSTIYSLIGLKQPAPLQEALHHSQLRVRKAALIALDQMEGNPLKREQIAPFLGAPDKDVRSAALWVVSHHPDWADVVLRYLDARLRDPAPSAAEMDGVRDALIAFIGNTDAQQLMAKVMSDPQLRDKQIVFLLDTIDASPLKELPAQWETPISLLLDRPGANVRLRTVDLIRSRAFPGFDQQIESIANDSKSSAQLRASALGILVSRNPKLSGTQYSFLLSRLGTGSDAVLRQTAARVIGRSTPDRETLLLIARKHLAQADPLIISTVLESFQSSSDQEVGEALIAVLRRSPSALGTLGEDRLKTLFAHYPDRVQQLSKPLLKQLQDAQRDRVQRLQKLEPLLTAGGDVGRGRRLFFGEKAACSSCHTIGTEGRQVGPDLTGIGAIRSGHDLLEAIVFPSASFVPGHEVYNVDTAVERLAGVIRSQSADAVVLVTGPDGEVRIPRSKIRLLQRSNVSLMPEGLDESLTRPELTDLLAFLQSEKTRPQAALRPAAR